MKEYDVIVIGSGSGMQIVEEALSHEYSVALVDKGPLGGTCPNLGCIPSRMLIYAADRIECNSCLTHQPYLDIMTLHMGV